MEKNYKLKISYDGSRYFGWEHQPDRETIQGKIETVLARMVDKDMVDVIGAGRTDAGVHARAMIANVHLDTQMSPEEIRDYANRYLPDDIAILEVREAADRFHARYKAVGKTYRYTCFDGPVKPVFDRKYYTPLDQELDVEAMQEAAHFLEGKHDYKSFCGNSRMKKSTVRRIDSIEFEAAGESRLHIRYTGNGFLQQMVRILTGTLIEAGLGKREPEQMKAVLEALNRQAAGFTAPAQGLFLEKVEYGEGK